MKSQLGVHGEWGSGGMNHKMKRNRYGAIDYFCISAIGQQGIACGRMVVHICNKLYEMAFCLAYGEREQGSYQDEGLYLDFTACRTWKALLE
jgi:hypothetical protein